MNTEQFLNYLILDGWVGCADSVGPGIKKPDSGECYWKVGYSIMYSLCYSRGSAIDKWNTDIRETPAAFLQEVALKMGVDYEP